MNDAGTITLRLKRTAQRTVDKTIRLLIALPLLLSALFAYALLGPFFLLHDLALWALRKCGMPCSRPRY